MTDEVVAPRNIRELLQHQFDPGNAKVLMPYLSTKSRQCLAECSIALSQYRHHLRRLSIVEPLARTAYENKALLRMIAGQEELEHLRLERQSIDAGLSLLSLGCCQHLVTLDLKASFVNPRDPVPIVTDSYAELLKKAICGGALSTLQILNLHGHELTNHGLSLFLRAFIAPAGHRIPCPELRHLNLECSHRNSLLGETEGEPGKIIADVLETNCFRGLQELNLQGIFTRETGNYSLVTMALIQHEHDLQTLPVDGGWNINWLHAEESTLEVLKAGRIPNLKRLDMSGISADNVCLYLDQLHRYQCLTHLRVATSNRDKCIHLITVLTNGHCRQLQELKVHQCPEEYQVAILQVFIADDSPCPNITHLSLTSGFGAEEVIGEVLGSFISAYTKGIESGAFHKLKWLDFEGRREKEEGEIETLLMALQNGGCPDLLLLCLDDVGMGPQGAAALVNMLSARTCKHLQDLHVSGNKDIGDEGVKNIIRALKPSFGLRVLRYEGSGEGDQAAEALLECLPKWPYLEELVISYPPNVTQRLLKLLGTEKRQWRGPRIGYLEFQPCSLDEETAPLVASALSRTDLLPELDELRIGEPCGVDWEAHLKPRAPFPRYLYFGVEPDSEKSEEWDDSEEEMDVDYDG